MSLIRAWIYAHCALSCIYLFLWVKMDYSQMPIVRRIRDLEAAMDSATVVAGWIDGNGSAVTAYAHLQAKRATGNDQPAVGRPASLALIARTLNYGREPGQTLGGRKYGRIPARPFMAFAAEIWAREYPRILKAYVPRVLNGTMSVDAFLAAMGERTRDAIKKAIETGTYAPLSPKTVARKGSSKPLVDTGRLLNSVTFEIRRDA